MWCAAQNWAWEQVDKTDAPNVKLPTHFSPFPDKGMIMKRS